MTTDAAPLFGGTELAERIERVETQMITAATEAARQRVGPAAFVIPIAGGAGCYAEDGSPLNKIVGLGFGSVPDGDALNEIEQAFAARGTATQVELANLTDPAIGTALTSRGYQLVGFENVLGRSLPGELQPVTAPGVEVRLSDDRAAWLDVVVDGFAHPDVEGVPSHEEFPREIVEKAMSDIEQAGATPYLAYRDGIVAGGGSMRLYEGVAQLTGAATAPAHRRRHHPAGIEIAAERATSGVSPALHACRAREASQLIVTARCRANRSSARVR